MASYGMTVAQSVSHFGWQAIAKLGEARHGRRKSEPPRTGEATPNAAPLGWERHLPRAPTGRFRQ